MSVRIPLFSCSVKVLILIDQWIYLVFRNQTSKDQRRAETNGRGMAPVGSRLPRAIASLFLLADGCVWSGIWSELDAS
ncbi:hypothetical protein F2Q69_00019416 [Brassica cretica]|uniref:Uncharacterized protein n=1 Tax=Brassica cretica TaxID=69181 RepID=A0A8S9Q5S5_BRACR|nr:hypothetical protein F2Q69_00019416 [Brassica cretica]